MDGSVLDCVASSTCMGPPLDRKVQGSARFTNGDARGAHKGKHSRALRELRVLEGMTGTAGRHQVPAAKTARTQARSRGTSGGELSAMPCIALRVEQLRAWTQRTMPSPTQGPGIEEAGNNRNAYAPRRSRPGWPREPVNTGHSCAVNGGQPPVAVETAGITGGT